MKSARWLALILAAASCTQAAPDGTGTPASAPVPSMAAPAALVTEATAATASAQTASPAPSGTGPGSLGPAEPRAPVLSVQTWCKDVGRAGALTRCLADPGLPRTRISLDEAISDDLIGTSIGAQIAEDLVAIQNEFEWSIRSSPVIDVYASTSRYAGGLREVFGYARATAEYLAENSVAFFEPSARRIAVNWAAISDRRPIAAIRHELAHLVTLEACAPRCDLVPAWFNEGEARLLEALIPGADWRLMRVRYEAASMVATGTLLPLAALWTQSQWNAYGDWDGYYKYQQAARAVELVRADVGDHAIARIYARLRAGDDFATAYARLSGRSWSSFVGALPARLEAGIEPGPAIAVVQPGADGTGASFLLYGFPSEAKVTLTLRARHATQTSEISVSPQGAHFGSIDASYPPGTYTISAASGSSVAAVTVVKRGGRAVRPAPGD